MDPVIDELKAVIRYCVHVGYADGARLYTRMLVRYVTRSIQAFD